VTNEVIKIRDLIYETVSGGRCQLVNAWVDMNYSGFHGENRPFDVCYTRKNTEGRNIVDPLVTQVSASHEWYSKNLVRTY